MHVSSTLSYSANSCHQCIETTMLSLVRPKCLFYPITFYGESDYCLPGYQMLVMVSTL